MKSVPSESTSQNLLFIDGIHVDFSKLTAFYRDSNTNLQKRYFFNKQVIIILIMDSK